MSKDFIKSIPEKSGISISVKIKSIFCDCKIVVASNPLEQEPTNSKNGTLEIKSSNNSNASGSSSIIIHFIFYFFKLIFRFTSNDFLVFEISKVCAFGYSKFNLFCMFSKPIPESLFKAFCSDDKL